MRSISISCREEDARNFGETIPIFGASDKRLRPVFRSPLTLNLGHKKQEFARIDKLNSILARKLSNATPSYKLETLLEDHKKMATVRRLREKRSHRFLDIGKIEHILNESSRKWLQDRSLRIDDS